MNEGDICQRCDDEEKAREAEAEEEPCNIGSARTICPRHGIWH